MSMRRLWPTRGTWPVAGLYLSLNLGKKAGREIPIWELSANKKRMRKSKKNMWKDKNSFFGPQNANVSNHLK